MSRYAVTIGNFDGVHRGHLALIHAIQKFKNENCSFIHGLKSLVITFNPHPVELISGKAVKKLTPLGKKISILKSLGIDEVKVIPFDQKLAHTPAHDFFKNVLLNEWNPAYFAIGNNFYFGHNREGTPERLLQWASEKNISAEMISPIEADGAPISSTRIRKLISEGQMTTATRFLGRDYSIEGEVIHGSKRGRQLGFPTANMEPLIDGSEAPCLPAMGVYLSHSTVEGKTFPSITNVGVKPTVELKSPLLIETHLLDFNGDLYGKCLTVEFRDRLRAEQKFKNIDELRSQIAEDTQLARQRLRNS